MTAAGGLPGGSEAFTGAANKFDPAGSGDFGGGTSVIDLGGTTAAPLHTVEVPDLSMYDGSQDASGVGTAVRSLAAGGLMGQGFREGNVLNRVGTGLQDRLTGHSMGLMRENAKPENMPKPTAQQVINESLGKPTPDNPGGRVPAGTASNTATDAAAKAAKVEPAKPASRMAKAGNAMKKLAKGTAPGRGLSLAKNLAVGGGSMVRRGVNAAGRTAAARAMAPIAGRLGARALAMAAAAAVPGPGWALAIGIGATIALEMVFNDKFRTWVANGIRGGGIDTDVPPSPPQTHFLPLARDERDEAIEMVDKRITEYNRTLVDIDPKEHRLWDIENPGVDRLEPMQSIVNEINKVSEGLNDTVASVGRIYSGGANSTWLGDQLEVLTPELQLMSTFGDTVGAPMIDAALHSAQASNEVFQAIREANAKSRDAIARSQGKWLSSVPMVGGFGRATVDENLMTDNSEKIEEKSRESGMYADKVADAVKDWGVLRPRVSDAVLNTAGWNTVGRDTGKDRTSPDDDNDPMPKPGPSQPGIPPRGPGGGGGSGGGFGSGGTGGGGGGGGSEEGWGKIKDILDGEGGTEDPGHDLTDPFGPPVQDGTDHLGDYGTGFGGGGFDDPTTGFGTGDGGAFGGDTGAPDTGSPFSIDGDPFGEPYDGGTGLGIDPETGTSSFTNPFGDDTLDDLFEEEDGDSDDPFLSDEQDGPLGFDIESSDDAPGGDGFSDGAFGGGGGTAGDPGDFDPFGDNAEGDDLFGGPNEGGTAPGDPGGGSGGGFGDPAGGEGSADGGGAFGEDMGDPADGSLFQGTDITDPGSPWGSYGDDAEMDPERTVEIDGEPVQFISAETADMVEAALDPAQATDGLAFREMAAMHGLELPDEGMDIGIPVSPAEMQPGDVLTSEGQQYMFIGGEEAMDLSTGEKFPLEEVAVFSGEHEGIFRLPGADGENLVPEVGGTVDGDFSDGDVTASQMSNADTGGTFERTDEAPIGMGAGQNVPGGASEGAQDVGTDRSSSGTSSLGDDAAPGQPAAASAPAGVGGIEEVPYEGRQFGGAETLGPQEGEVSSESIGGATSATSSLPSGSSGTSGLDPSRVTGGS